MKTAKKLADATRAVAEAAIDAADAAYTADAYAVADAARAVAEAYARAYSDAANAEAGIVARPATAQADATDADIASYHETSAVLVDARAARIAAQAAEALAEVAHYPTVRAVFFND